MVEDRVPVITLVGRIIAGLIRATALGTTVVDVLHYREPLQSVIGGTRLDINQVGLISF